jgi:hypothetical protein
MFKPINLNAAAKRKQSVAWNVAGGWINNAVLIFQGFVFIPLYLHFLGERLYGFWLATGGLLAWLAMADLGAAAITQQRCAAAYGRKDFRCIVNYFWHGLIVLCAVVAVVALGILWMSGHIVSWLNIDLEYQHEIYVCFLLAGVGVMFRLANDFMSNFAISLQRSLVPMAGSSVAGLVGLLSIFLGLFVFRWGVYALVLGLLVRSLIPFCVNFVYTLRILAVLPWRFKWSAPTMKDYLVTTPAVLAAKSTTQFAKNLPPILLTRMVGPEATVAYNVSMRILQVGSGFINQALAGLYAACSHLFGDVASHAAKEGHVLGRLCQGFIVSASIGVVLYALLNQGFVVLWTSPDQFAGQSFTSFYALAGFLILRGNLYVGMGMSLGRINTFEIIQSFEYIFQAWLLYMSIAYFGVIAVPFAIVLSSLIFQAFYHRALLKARPVVGRALSSLAWVALPLAAALFASYWIAPLFRFESWLPFLVTAVLVCVPFLAIFVYAMPGGLDLLRSKFEPILRKLAPRVLNSEKS